MIGVKAGMVAAGGISRPWVADPHWSSVVLAMPMDGTNGSTTFTDLKGKSVTAVGNAQISTAQSKFGGASAYFDGDGDRLYTDASSDFTMGTGDFTIEIWIRPTGSGTDSYARLFQIGNNTADGAFYVVREAATTPWKVRVDGYSGSNYVTFILTNNLLATDTWYHLAIVRSAGVFFVFVDGELAASDSGHTSYSITQQVAHIGSNHSNTESIQAYIDGLRITKGVARYTANFTPSPYL